MADRPRQRLTIFSLPKPFTDPVIARIQSDAIRSWQFLGPEVEVLLLGSDAGIKAFAEDNGLSHAEDIEANRQGTPLVNSAFAQANRIAKSELLLYCNADVILRGDIVSLAEQLGEQWPDGFLALGRRTEIDMPEELNWSDREAVNERLDEAVRLGSKAPRVCKEYFLFRRGQYSDLPAFAVGRGNWDNWMVSQARRSGTPVIDVSRRIQALHQAHGYSHLRGRAVSRPNRWNCYVAGEEARANEKLAGGKRLVSGTSTDWFAKPDGTFQKKRLSWMNGDFWLDLPRFVWMSMKLPFQR